MTELRIFPHWNHWHVQWLADGDRGLVYADGCDGYATHAEADAARSELLERHVYAWCEREGCGAPIHTNTERLCPACVNRAVRA